MTPTFIGIGAARSGTTWLAKNLDMCPEVWIPPRKEIHYFTHGFEYRSPSFLANDGVLTALFGTQEHHFQFRNKLFRAMANNLRHVSFAQIRWDLKYFFGKRDDAWYRSLFENREEPITGEITPAYALLSDDDVARISKAFPHAKIIYIVRNPVHREWSTLLYHEKRSRIKIASLPRQDVIRYLSQPGLTERSDHAAVVRRWLRYFGPEHFLLVFYDEIVNYPERALDRVFRFLGVTDRENLIENAGYDAVNTSKSTPMPDWLEAWLSRKHLSCLEEFSRMVGEYSDEWLVHARAAITRDR